MLKFIPDDINIDFMGARKKAFITSGIVVLVSIIATFTMGLNLGIDFKGGSSATLAFKKGSVTDRGNIDKSVAALVAAQLGVSDSEISVQDFDAGSGNSITVCTETPGQPPVCTTEEVDRYLVYTEVSTLITDAKTKELNDAISAKFGAGTKIQRPSGSDTFYLRFENSAGIPERAAELKALFLSQGFEQISVRSDFEQQLLTDFLREQQLILQDNAAAEKDGATANLQKELTEADYDALKLEELAGKSDARFTVHVEELRAKLNAQLSKDFPGKFLKVEGSSSVSPAVGADLLNNGLLAILYALVGILIYITVRFDFRYAPGAVVALLHDVIITIGIFAVLQVKFSLPIIAALLTIVGYSLNDTIVVLDRVRETFADFKGRDLTVLLNRAINSTLSRTVLTSFTTMLVVLAILFFGGGTIKDFALALFIGVVVGTYSSIFVASPLVYYMDQYLKRRETETVAANSRAGNNKPGKSNKARA